jgi:hypothetical protein
MEHRWGQRVKFDLTVRVAGRPYSVRPARLIDLSASGAFLEVSPDLRLLARLQVVIALPDPLTHPTPMITAYVVRRTGEGVGVEWCEYGPQPVLELLKFAAAHRYGPRRAAQPARYCASSDSAEQPKIIAKA